MALNPVAYTEAVIADFLRYQLTTYPLADVDLHAQLRTLLSVEESGKTPLRKGPFVSLSRPFKTGATIAQLVQEGVFHPAMETIVPFPGLRMHQESAIRAIARGDTTLVSTGTGSGKTEAFLYPIISRCLALEAAKAPPGVVAVLIYPMNALAEDQLDRLRGLLAGRGVSFGMYVGKTPDTEAQVRAQRMPAGSSNADYHARLAELREAGHGATLLPQEERASRASMREKGRQPRILLTNVKQLELLLTRGKDVGIFAEAPLEFLVFDEAHTFRGAQGAETACLIRRLRTFAGRRPEEVVHIATSATMADPIRGVEAAKDFARRFFGVSGAITVVGEVYDELRWNERRAVPAGPEGGEAEALGLLGRILDAVDAPDADAAEAISAGLVALGGARLGRKDWPRALASQLASNELVNRLAARLDKPAALSDLPQSLSDELGRDVTVTEILCWLALGAATGRGGHDPLLRPVVHTFVRGIGGAVVTFMGDTARLWLGGEEAVAALGDGIRAFPVLSCTTCGQHYYETWVQDFVLETNAKGGPGKGELVSGRRFWEHRDGGDRVLLVDRLVVQPDPEDDEPEEDDAADESQLPSGHDYAHRRLAPVWVCRACGTLASDRGASCPSCQQQAAMVAVQAVRMKPELPGHLHACIACQSLSRRPQGGRLREPARPLRAVGVSDVHVLAQSMVHLAERPRLLVFSDNRQDAAFQAGWMRDHARRFRLRTLMAKALEPAALSVGDLSQALDGLLEHDRELSRALIPEVWQVAPQDDASVKHREERLYFLRLQVLRELATGVKQRIGLEPWGRLRVDYLGVDAGMAFIARWAPRLGVEPERLADGVRSLLDHTRRLRVLHDAPTRIYGRFWQAGDKEVQYGYLPAIGSGPRGLKLTRTGDDKPARVVQWRGSRPTHAWNTVLSWGVADDAAEGFLNELWAELVGRKVLVPTQLVAWSKPMAGTTGVYQVDAGKVLLAPHRGRWRCAKCRRTSLRQGPTGVCIAWRCGGRLAWEIEDPEDFDLQMLDQDYTMLRVHEHSAQVPHAIRERIENQFKSESKSLNTLVCTPTLELGVDIGALDSVLMRNVPPSAASYWQRAGRAGRRHRMAVDVTYAQATSFDQAYFREPLKLLRGLVEAPRFNLKNEVMIKKHVHATVLTALLGIARAGGDREAAASAGATLALSFPPTLRPYLFAEDGTVRAEPLDTRMLAAAIARHRTVVVRAVEQAFRESWPDEDRDVVASDVLGRLIDGMAEELQVVIRRLKRRLDWALGELARLARVEKEQGILDPDDQSHRGRCQRVVARLKGTVQRGRAQAQGGGDDAETMGALSREGFLPGYGLESGSIVGTAEVPRFSDALEDFELPRAPSLALREYIPGNAIYANGLRFVPRRFKLTATEVLRFRVSTEQQVIQEAGVDQAVAQLGDQEIRAVPICDVSLPAQAQISDEEEFRFQMSVAVYGLERKFHRGGLAWRSGELDVRWRRGLHLRLVNTGPKGEVEAQRLGYMLCLVCGMSHSPFSSKAAREEFEAKHLERCKQPVRPTGFYADVEVDVLGLHDIVDRSTAFSVAEALRMGAARVLDMEVEDLQLLVLGRPGEDRVDILLYDPMPGGSGLLPELAQRWEEVRAAALDVATNCAQACERSCIDCLHTYRNRFYHSFLDRHCAAEVLGRTQGPLVFSHPIADQLPRTSSTTGEPQTVIEARFRRFLVEAGLPEPECQKRVELGVGHGHTIPDFFYPGDDGEPGVCVYLDGMAGHIHGNAAQAENDRRMREVLRAKGYEVVEVKSFELDDATAVIGAIARIAKYVSGRELQRRIKDEPGWFERVVGGGSRAKARGALRIIRGALEGANAIPLFDLQIAAGAFSDDQIPVADEYVTVVGETAKSGWFVARVVGESMNRVAPNGALCVWEHVSTTAARPIRDGDLALVRLEDDIDSEMGRFTFKRIAIEGTRYLLAPISDRADFAPTQVDPARMHVVARFVGVVESEQAS